MIPKLESWKKQRPWLYRLGIVLSLCLAVFLVLETLSALFLWMQNPARHHRVTDVHAVIGHRDIHPFRDDELQAPYHPLIGWHPRGAVRPHPNRGQLGFIPNHPSDTIAIDPSADVRVYVIGSSRVAGLDKSRTQTLPALLERELENRRDLNVNVVNAGVNGWYSVHALAFLTQEVLPFHEPDLVVILGGYSDSLRSVVAARKFQRTSGGWWSSESNYLYDPRLQWYLDTIKAIQRDAGYVFDQLLYTLGISPYVDYRRYFTGALLTGTRYPPDHHDLEEFTSGNVEPPDDCSSPPVNVHPFLENIQSSLGAAEGWDVPLVYVLEPTIVYKQSLTSREQQWVQVKDRWLHEEGWPLYRIPTESCWTDLQRKFYRRVKQGIQGDSSKFRSSRSQVLDFSDLFRDRPESLFRSPTSYSHRGHRMIARELAKTIEPLLESSR